MTINKAHATRLRFRELMATGSCLYPASVFDPLSARLAGDAGFEIGMLAGSTASMSVLAAPDLLVLTLTELAEQARRIGRASDLPLLVDADHGYGGTLNVRRTVEELEHAGVAALTIEDTLLPTPFGATGKTALISCEEGIAKLHAAVDARDDVALVIVGRTSALQVTGMADTLVRIKAYEACGVDAIFLVGVTDWGQLAQLREATRLPLILGNASPALADRKRLTSHGVVINLQGHQPMAAVIQALHTTYCELRAGILPGALTRLAPADLMQQASRASAYDKWNARATGVPRQPSHPQKSLIKAETRTTRWT